MSLGQLKDEGDLQRWLERQLDDQLGTRFKSLSDSSGERKRGEESVTMAEGAAKTPVIEVAHGMKTDTAPKVFLQIGTDEGVITFTARVVDVTTTHFKFMLLATSVLEEDVDFVVTWEAVI